MSSDRELSVPEKLATTRKFIETIGPVHQETLTGLTRESVDHVGSERIKGVWEFRHRTAGGQSTKVRVDRLPDGFRVVRLYGRERNRDGTDYMKWDPYECLSVTLDSNGKVGQANLGYNSYPFLMWSGIINSPELLKIHQKAHLGLLEAISSLSPK